MTPVTELSTLYATWFELIQMEVAGHPDADVARLTLEAIRVAHLNIPQTAADALWAAAKAEWTARTGRDPLTGRMLRPKGEA
jgi:hypothetical protein